MKPKEGTTTKMTRNTRAEGKNKKEDGGKKKKKRTIRYMGREFVPSREEFEGIPIVSRYKYLGTYLDSTLKIKTQLDFIRDKSDFLAVKLYLYLANATAGGRKDMWRTMVYPLFSALFVLLYFEQSKTNYKQAEKLWHQTFKGFMMIPQSTGNSLVKEMTGPDLEELIYVNTQNSV